MRFGYYPKLAPSGLKSFLHIVRAPGDPARRSREDRQAMHGRGSSTEWKNVQKLTPEQWAEKIFEHLADGVPRTFNRIMVELADHTADVVFGKNPDKGFWQLVRDSRIQLSTRVPIFARRLPEPRNPGVP